MSDSAVDFVAVARVARRVELVDLRLMGISATTNDIEKGLLEADVTQECTPEIAADKSLLVRCNYEFRVKSNAAEFIKATLAYLLKYKVLGTEPLVERDVNQFAFANGIYHSWPFVRQTLFDLTARMGLPPYVLPVFVFRPSKPAEPPSRAEAQEPDADVPEGR